MGLLSTYLIVDIAMDGSIPLHLCLISWYSDSVIVCQHGKDWRPSYSSLYDLSHMSLSFLGSFRWEISVGTSWLINLAAETWRATADVIFRSICKFLMFLNLGWPSKI